MTTIDQFRQALKDDADTSRTDYWNALDVIADPSSSEAARQAALKDLAQAANEIGADAEQIDDDVQLLRLRRAQPDLDVLERDNNAEARQLSDEAQALTADASAARARSDELARQAEVLRGRANSMRTAVNNAKQEARSLQRKLADRGCPVAMIEVAVEAQQQQIAQAEAVVEAAERELAEATELHETAKADKRRSDFGNESYDPLANAIARAQREVERAKKVRDELRERIEVESPQVVEPETREQRTMRRAKAEAKGKRIAPSATKS